MLHAGILPHHPRWAKLFENLRYIVIDELHAYRGVFGSHLANVLRRLRRICRHYGSSPTFICSSATIANPRRAGRAPDRAAVRAGRRERRAARREVLPVREPADREPAARHPAVVHLARPARRARVPRSKGLQVIVFAQSRLSTEILTRYLKDAHEGEPGASDAIRGYRGGYLPHRRREIEKGLRDGHGARRGLDQRARAGHRHRRARRGGAGRLPGHDRRRRGSAPGRAGRRASRSAAVLVASSAPLDQFVVRHPSYFFDASPEHALVNPGQPAHPRRPRQVRGVRAAVHGRRGVRPRERAGDAAACCAEEGLRAPEPARGRRRGDRAVALDERVVSGRRGQPALGLVRQLRRRRQDRRDARHRRDRLHQRAGDRSTRRRSTSSKAGCSRWRSSTIEGRKAYVREVDCDYYTDAITYSRVTVLDTFGDGGRAGRGAAARTATSTSCRAWSASRRSSSTRTRTSARASSTCPSSRCTRRRTG